MEVVFSLSDDGEEVISVSANVRQRDVDLDGGVALAIVRDVEVTFLLAAEGGEPVLLWQRLPLQDVQLFFFATGSKQGQRAVEQLEQWLQLQQRSVGARPVRGDDDDGAFFCEGAGFAGVRGGNSSSSLVSVALRFRVFSVLWGVFGLTAVPFFLERVCTVSQGGLADRSLRLGICFTICSQPYWE